MFSRRSGRRSFAKSDRTHRAITFYAEDHGTWPHFEPIVAALVDDLGRDVCYLTSQADDPVLANPHPKIRAFAIGDGMRRAYSFGTMEAGVVVLSVPQLGVAALPRSRLAASLGTKYVHVFHSMVSTHMAYEADAYDHYDVVCCVGPYMVDEIRRREASAGIPPKQLIEHGYGRLDTILAAAAADRVQYTRSDPPIVLVAPSWGPNGIFETCGVEVVSSLLDAGFEVIARPHPMTKKHASIALQHLRTTCAGRPELTFDDDVASFATLRRADVMVSDWSGAALEFAFGLERPVVYVDVAPKVNNPDYEAIGLEPFEASVRARIGRVVPCGRLADLGAVVREVLADAERLGDAIRAVRDESIHNLGTSGRVAADLIARKADEFLARSGGGR